MDMPGNGKTLISLADLYCYRPPFIKIRLLTGTQWFPLLHVPTRFWG